MPDDTRNDDDRFAERIARPLRASERFSDDFETSLVAAIRNERPVDARLAPRRRPLSPSWWAAPSLSPLAGLALAAGLAAVAALGTLRVARGGAPAATAVPMTVAQAPAAAAVHDTVTLVRFVFVGEAKTVSLVGDFNNWGADATPLAHTGANHAWAAAVPVPAGRHEYAFIVDGKKWVPDQFAPTSSDEFEANSSVITVQN